jgi:hypothetical protein
MMRSLALRILPFVVQAAPLYVAYRLVSSTFRRLLGPSKEGQLPRNRPQVENTSVVLTRLSRLMVRLSLSSI